ncbi:methenyltetrahydrofolate synthase domain-containing protein-like [Ptychodera flava]|uniref:methenyltetrahydrofolate synthase domain-containing protein-like n=1 Tax=Ptychodera flava TaxID=63121 RepID=UPI00396A93CE
MAGDITKASIRQKIWDYLEANNLASFPRPVHHRIPNFKGAPAANDQLKELDVFKKSRTVKINPDKPQEHARFLTLEAKKTLMVPTPRLKTGLFNKITPPKGCNKETLRTCSTSQGVRQYSLPIGLDDQIKVDLVIVGSVAVSTKGHRIGKGEGFADMEYAMMSSMGAVDQNTIVITTVHDCQVMDLPDELFDSHDLTLDYILTPTRLIKCEGNLPKPTGIIWRKLTLEKFNQIPILKNLRFREKKAGKDVRLKHEFESMAEETSHGSKSEKHADAATSVASEPKESKSQVQSRGNTPPSVKSNTSSSVSVFVGGISRGLRVSEFKAKIRENNVLPIKVTWHGARGFAFLQFENNSDAEAAVSILDGLDVHGSVLRSDIAKDKGK